MVIEVNSAKLGPLKVESDQLITFPDGIPGFPNVKRYFLIENDIGHPLGWLQAVEDPELAFVVTDPMLFNPDYKPQVPLEEFKHLEIDGGESLALLVIVNVPQEDPLKMTANFMAPLVINAKIRVGKQVILNDTQYSHREPLLMPAASGRT
ncbi:MAG: flagellar assembly protein FliW [Candidatus Manganitrophus sp. SB1]|nr:flagellar assembly protein FliW [Candidatus Manganitrophus morganii]